MGGSLTQVKLLRSLRMPWGTRKSAEHGRFVVFERRGIADKLDAYLLLGVSMFDRIFEMIEMFLVNLGLAMNRMSNDEKKTVTMFLASLMFAAIASRVLQAAFIR